MTTNEFYTTTGEEVAATNRDTPHFLYNVESAVEVDSQESRWRTLPERAGILTHPVWLGAHADNFEDGTGVIYRGYWIRKHMLCEPVDPVTGAIEAKLVESSPQLRARDRVYLSTEDPANPQTAQCRGCHGLMNSLGYPFEEFNHAGFVRFDDHGNMPDGSTTLENMPRNSDLEAFDGRQLSSAAEFTSMLADSQHVKQCFIRHTFRYFMGRPETQADACTLRQMEVAYDDSGGSFVELLVALMTSDAFLYTRPWEENP